MSVAELFADFYQWTVTAGGTTAPTAGSTENLTVASATGAPAASSSTPSEFWIVDAADTHVPPEYMKVTNVAGTTFSVTRGAAGSAPWAHAANWTAQPVLNPAALLNALSTVEPPGVVKQYAGFSAPTGYLFCDGAPYPRTNYARLFNALTIQTTGNTHTSGLIDGVPSAAVAQMLPGMPISGSGIPAGATITQIASTTSFAVSPVPTSALTGTALVIAPYGVGDGSTTFNVPDMRGKTAIGAGASTISYVQQVLNLGPKGFWGLNETSGTAAADASTTGDNGTYTGTYSLNQTGPLTSAPTRGAVGFTGVAGSEVSIPYNAALDIQQPSVECWVSPGSMTANGGFFEKSVGGAVNTGYLLFMSGGTLYFRVVDSGGTAHDVSWGGWGSLPSSYHLVDGVYEGNFSRLYVDGVLVASAQLGALTLKTGSGASQIGNLFTTPFVLNGSIADVAVYGFALSPAQVLANYRAGVPFAMGAVGGEETHPLATAELPAHTHSVTDASHSHTNVQGNTGFGGTNSGWIAVRDDASTLKILGGTGGIAVTLDQPSDFTMSSTATGITGTNSTGNGQTHNNLQPYNGLNYIIKV